MCLQQVKSMNHNTHHKQQKSLLTRIMPKTGHGWMMVVCCALMLASAASIFIETGEDVSTSNGLVALLPIVGCLVMHMFMHRMMGGHCDHEKEEKVEPRELEIPSFKNTLQKEQP